MTKELLTQLETQQYKVIELEDALTWIKRCITGDAGLCIKERPYLRDMNANPLEFHTISKFVQPETYKLIVAAIESDIKERLDVERKIFEEM